MGRIKTQMIKRLTHSLLKNYRSEFTTEFTANKVAVESHLQPVNKKLRNVIAGYVTRLMKNQEHI